MRLYIVQKGYTPPPPSIETNGYHYVSSRDIGELVLRFSCEPGVDVLPFDYHASVLMEKESIFSIMSESSEQWYNRQAVEQLALHIPFERDTATKSEQIEMLRGLVIRHGRTMDPHMFGFEARTELIRLGLWSRIGPQDEQ